MFKQLKGSKGFTLLESILGTLIIAAGVLGGLIVMQNCTTGAINTDLSSVATQLANEKMESIIADKEYRGFDYLDDPGHYPDENVGGTNDNTFVRSVDIEDVNAEDLATTEDDSGIKKVNVVVRWGDQAYQAVNVTTLLTDYDDI